MNTQDLCLGVLHLCDASGYEIKQMFESTLSHFQNPSYGSIYPALRQLQKTGMVNVKVKEQERRPAKKIYRITGLGRSHFQQVLKELAPNESCRSNFILLSFYAHLLESEKFESVLSQHVLNVRQSLDTMEAIEELQDMTVGMRFTLEYGMYMKKTQLAYLKDNLHKILREHRMEQQRLDSEQH